LADKFTHVELGEAVVSVCSQSFKCESAVTKGQVVKLDTHTDDELGSVSPAGAGDKAEGVALKTGAAGEYIPVLQIGKVKVTGGGAITLGGKIKAGAAGKVVAAVTTVTIPTDSTAVLSTSAQPSMNVEGGLAFGHAEQTIGADGDTLVVSINCLG